MKYLPKIALGAWAWGNDGTFGSSFTSDQLRPIFEAAMKNGLNLWDTAFAYGMGTSEKMLAGFIKGLPRESYLISDKFTPQCADSSSPTAMQDMIEMQLGLMELDRFDVYWIHNVWDAPKWTEELAKALEVSRQTICSLENGKYNPSIILAFKIAKFSLILSKFFWLYPGFITKYLTSNSKSL